MFDSAPLLRYRRGRFADRWLPLSSRRSTCRPAHPVVGRPPQRLAQRALGRGGRGYYQLIFSEEGLHTIIVELHLDRFV
jgi:hypothetical protein